MCASLIRVTFIYKRRVVFVCHTLRSVRQAIGWTVAELAELADISESTIRRIEEDASPFRFNYETASSLAAALDVKVETIFRPEEQSHLGRPPHTGTNCQKPASHGPICSSCSMELPATLICDDCGPRLALVAG